MSGTYQEKVATVSLQERSKLHCNACSQYSWADVYRILCMHQFAALLRPVLYYCHAGASKGNLVAAQADTQLWKLAPELSLHSLLVCGLHFAPMLALHGRIGRSCSSRAGTGQLGSCPACSESPCLHRGSAGTCRSPHALAWPPSGALCCHPAHNRLLISFDGLSTGLICKVCVLEQTLAVSGRQSGSVHKLSLHWLCA